MNIAYDVILTYLVPYLSYFDIDDVLTTLKLLPEIITEIKKREHAKRLKMKRSNDCSYYIEDKLHNEYGPALIDEYGKKWYLNGLLHRIDGPAIEWVSGTMEWYQHGARHRLDGPARVTFVTEEWYQHGARHRLDGPAYISKTATVWYKHNKLHNPNGPAKTWKDGSEEWYQNNKLHNPNGPAVTYPRTSEKFWYTHGKRIK